ncbi:hypothetical protein ACQR1I_01920 [Bradyrhizobium sp. HKCCYLS2038]|uniref:hypothetical protein n=1 Tax=unclassified Bradyrhizobium TaxID=2631580 RepID=UPI003EB770F3
MTIEKPVERSIDREGDLTAQATATKNRHSISRSKGSFVSAAMMLDELTGWMSAAIKT